MPKASSCAVLGVLAALSAAAGTAQAQPIALSTQDMDAVTAGAVEVDVVSGAAASGAFNHTRTHGAAVAASVQGADPAIAAQVGAAGGTAFAVAAGENASTATSVSTSGSADGTFVVSSSTNWTLAGPGGQLSGGFTWVSGRTGAFLLGGP
jgi:hypothetical protein